MMGLPSAAYTPNVFYGGMAGDKSTVKAYLSETISTSDYSNRYFYVLPSDNDDGNTTLITLAGTYDGSPPISRSASTTRWEQAEASSDGTFIRRNYVYTVNVKLKRLGGGSSNPEVPARSGVARYYRRAAGLDCGTRPGRRVVAGNGDSGPEEYLSSGRGQIV